METEREFEDESLAPIFALETYAHETVRRQTYHAQCIYVLKNILHDWEDGRARQILARCREAMTAEARLLVVENLVYGPNKPCKGKSGDINMMVRSGGRNRTETELGGLLFASGFQVLRVIPTDGPDLLEASLAD